MASLCCVTVKAKSHYWGHSFFSSKKHPGLWFVYTLHSAFELHYRCFLLYSLFISYLPQIWDADCFFSSVLHKLHFHLKSWKEDTKFRKNQLFFSIYYLFPSFLILNSCSNRYCEECCKYYWRYADTFFLLYLGIHTGNSWMIRNY